MSMSIARTSSFQLSQNSLQRTNQYTAQPSQKDAPKISISGINPKKLRETADAKMRTDLREMVQGIKTAAEEYGEYLNNVIKESNAAGEKIAEMLEDSGPDIESIRSERITSGPSASVAAEMVDKNGEVVRATTYSDSGSDFVEPAFVLEISPQAQAGVANAGQVEHASAPKHNVHASSKGKLLDVAI